MTWTPKTEEQKAKLFLEYAENARKKGQMLDKLIGSGKLENDKLKEYKEQSRVQWMYHDEYLEKSEKILQAGIPPLLKTKDLVADAKEVFNLK